MKPTGAFQEIQVINRTFLYRFASYTRQFIGLREKIVHISFCLFIQVFINLKRSALYAMLSAFRKELLPLFRCKFGNSFLKTFEPISQIHKLLF